MDRKEYQRYFLEKELFEQSAQHTEMDFEDYYPDLMEVKQKPIFDKEDFQ